MLLFAFVPMWLAKRRGTSNVGQVSQGVSQRKSVLLLIVAFVIGCSIGLARIYVGVHYPDDIVGGAIDGLLAALLVTVLRRWLWRPTNAVLRFAHTLRVA
jgi:membrane-associated phospholipid phosphatase